MILGEEILDVQSSAQIPPPLHDSGVRMLQAVSVADDDDRAWARNATFLWNSSTISVSSTCGHWCYHRRIVPTVSIGIRSLPSVFLLWMGTPLTSNLFAEQVLDSNVPWAFAKRIHRWA